jgi:transcriptional regulator with XRE-family HTH domain
LGKHLRSLRKTYGFTQEYVASQLNIIHQTYSHYETGRIVPPAETLYALSRLYRIPAEELLQLLVKDGGNEKLLQNDFYVECNEDSDLYLEFINAPDNRGKYKSLTSREKRLLYYFQQLNRVNQEKLLDMLKIELKHQDDQE